MPGHSAAMGADPCFQPLFGELTDLREVTAITATAAEITELARVSPFGASARRAQLATSDLAFGVARMFHADRIDAALGAITLWDSQADGGGA